MMKQKMVMCLLAGVLALGIGGCGKQEVEVPEVENVETAEEEPVPKETAEEEGDEQKQTDSEKFDTEVVEETEQLDAEAAQEEASVKEDAVEPEISPVVYENGEQITLDPSWTYADYSKINSGAAVLYKAR